MNDANGGMERTSASALSTSKSAASLKEVDEEDEMNDANDGMERTSASALSTSKSAASLKEVDEENLADFAFAEGKRVRWSLIPNDDHEFQLHLKDIEVNVDGDQSLFARLKVSPKQTFAFSKLPGELKLLVLQELSSRDLNACRLACRWFNQFIIGNWSHLNSRRIGSVEFIPDCREVWGHYFNYSRALSYFRNCTISRFTIYYGCLSSALMLCLSNAFQKHRISVKVLIIHNCSCDCNAAEFIAFMESINVKILAIDVFDMRELGNSLANHQCIEKLDCAFLFSNGDDVISGVVVDPFYNGAPEPTGFSRLLTDWSQGCMEILHFHMNIDRCGDDVSEVWQDSGHLRCLQGSILKNCEGQEFIKMVPALSLRISARYTPRFYKAIASRRSASSKNGDQSNGVLHRDTTLRNVDVQFSTSCGEEVDVSAVVQDTLPSGSRIGSVVAIHGAPGSHKDFKYIAPLLQERGIRFIGVNMPGFGLSPGDPRLQCDNFERDNFIHELIKRMDIAQPMVIMSHSRGTENATSVAARNIDKLAGLVLLNPTGLRRHRGLPLWPIRCILWIYSLGSWTAMVVHPLMKFLYNSILGLRLDSGERAMMCVRTMCSMGFASSLLPCIDVINRNKASRVLVAYSGEDFLVEPSISRELAVSFNDCEELSCNEKNQSLVEIASRNTQDLYRRGTKTVAINFKKDGHFLQRDQARYIADSVDAILRGYNFEYVK
ncbi:hypothetical protein Q1695_007476 [Nippostrongylus brasiliensis]|nr:hypothetical protein Q1695_007476 [Nippostrongylus brasiliensis]